MRQYQGKHGLHIRIGYPEEDKNIFTKAHNLLQLRNHK